jgi:hypothetical protein
MSDCVTIFLKYSLNIRQTKGFVCVHSSVNSSSGDIVTVSVEYSQLLFLTLVRYLSDEVTSGTGQIPVRRGNFWHWSDICPAGSLLALVRYLSDEVTSSTGQIAARRGNFWHWSDICPAG